MLAEECKKQSTYLTEVQEKYITFTVTIEKYVAGIEKKLQKIYLTYYDLLIVQDLWQGHYQILSIIFLKEFI